MTTLTVKTGATFSFDIVRKDSNGNPVDISGMDVTAKITGNGFSDDLVVTKTDAVNGAANVSRADTVTANWPGGVTNPTTLYMDVKYDDGTNADYSETIVVKSVKGIS